MSVLISLDRSAQAHRVASPSPATHSIDYHLLGEGAPDFNKNSIEIQHNHINLSLKSGAPFVRQYVQGGAFTRTQVQLLASPVRPTLSSASGKAKERQNRFPEHHV